MIITRRSAAARYSTDAVAQDVRDFIAPSARFESQPAAAPNASSTINLALLYPSIFGAASQASRRVWNPRAALGTV
jgi:hypothetical protein